MGHTHTIQVNAIKSWTRLKPRPQIILFGDEPGTAQVARELRVRHSPHVACNKSGTPLLNDAFSQAHSLAENNLLVYANADILFFNNLVAAAKQVQAAFEQFLIIGRRTNFSLATPVDFDNKNWAAQLRANVAAKGTLAAVVCKDYFVFPRPLFSEIPEFAVGRGNWDNWLVSQAHRQKMPVIDVTAAVTAVHQNHDYTHLAGGGVASVIGAEARQNAEMGNGMNLIYGSASTWQLTADGLKRKRLPPLVNFLLDAPRFFLLLRYLYRLR